MPIFDLFSKRQKRLRGEIPDVYQYENMPEPLRVQIVHIITDALGITKDRVGHPNRPKRAYEFIHSTICREYGVFTLGQGNYDERVEENVLQFILNESDIEKVLDVVELTFKYIEIYIKENLREYTFDTTIKIEPNDAIKELNDRFKEHGFGYQYAGRQIIKIDSSYMHSEVVKPTLKLLWNNKFKGANDEYLKAHEHYRHGRNKECLVYCLKAFESIMKVICKEKGWNYSNTDTARRLIDICLQNNLVPSYIQNQFTSLKSILESGIPTIRNRQGGHGQGSSSQIADDEITRYALNLTGANIIYLIEQSGI
jgi:hypothetical protein